MEKKQCYTCKEWKDLDCFGKDRNKKDGLKYKCKKCEKEYYEEHKLEIIKRNREYAINHKEKTSEYQKEYWEKNKESSLQKYKKYNNSPLKFNSKSKYRKEIEIYEKELRESKEGYLECKCAYCGDWFTPTYLNVRHRLSVINSDKNLGESRLYCSEVCKQACPTFNQKLYPKGFKPATSREVQPELRQMVLARDNYICKRCGKHKNELDVALHCHHLEGIQWVPLESADIDQCITYCATCHVKAHQTPGCGYYDMQCIY